MPGLRFPRTPLAKSGAWRVAENQAGVLLSPAKELSFAANRRRYFLTSLLEWHFNFEIDDAASEAGI
jgi:hypothetical protein